MKFKLESSAQNLISHYGIGDISVNGQPHVGSLIITPSQLIGDWYSGQAAELTLADFEPLFALPEPDPIEIIILGTGTTHIFPPMKLMAALHAKRMALEVMNTRAACRTYSVLVSEQRPVAAALLPIT
ncbi:MAG: MTH938/NDUFAF3 family protein [Granulosicoccaceae bacterium]